MTETDGSTVRIERTFAATAEEVFDAWTSAEVMRRWFHVDPAWETPVAEVDAQVGGKVRIVMRSPESGDHGARGEYTVIDRPRRLQMTWAFDDDPSNEQLIELSFSEADGATTVVFVNTGIATDERRQSQDRGWNGCLDQLERALVG